MIIESMLVGMFLLSIANLLVINYVIKKQKSLSDRESDIKLIEREIFEKARLLKLVRGRFNAKKEYPIKLKTRNKR